MGIIGKRHKVEANKPHFSSTGGVVTTPKVCVNCPLRLAYDYWLYKGIGTKMMNKIIIVPNPNDEYIDIILNEFPDILEDTYITPFIKCKESDTSPLDNKIIKRCLHILSLECKFDGIADIMILGDAARYTFGIDNISVALNKLIIAQKPKRRCCVNYDPLVKYKDTNKFNTFKEYLTKWIYATKTKIFDYDLQIL